MNDVTIEMPGHPPIKTTSEVFSRAAAAIKKENAKPAQTPATRFAKDQLKSIIERIERLESEKAEIAEQIKEVFGEAKGNGFDVKILRMVVRIRKQDRAKRMETEAILDLYLSAIGEL